MTPPRIAVCAGVALMAALPACSYYPKEEGDKLRNEVYALQTQVNAMQQALDELQKDSKSSLSKIDKELTALNTSARRNDADLGVQLDEAMQQVARAKGFVDSANERLSALESSVQKVQEELDLRFQNMQEQARVQALKSQEEKERAIADARKNERLLGDPKELFEEVRSQISAGKPAEARKQLRELTIRAKSDKSLQKHLPEATFLIGETYFAEENYNQAAAEYNNVRKNYAKSPQLADALFKLGMVFEKLKLPNDARLFYETLREKFPKSPLAKDAKARLDKLK